MKSYRISLLVVSLLINSSEAIKHRLLDLNDDQGGLEAIKESNNSGASDHLAVATPDVPRSSEQATDAQEAESKATAGYDEQYSHTLKPASEDSMTQSLAQGQSQAAAATYTAASAGDATLSWNAIKTRPARFKSTKKSWDEPDNLLPEFKFESSWNTETYQGSVAANDFPEMRMQTLRKGDGRICEKDEWATVSWKAYINGEDPTLIHDSHREAAGEGPKQFRIGNYQVSRCWDMALQMMSKGQMAKVYCPPFLDKGGSTDNFRQSGTAWIKENTAITYEFEVLSCQLQLDFPKDEPVIPKRCVFIVFDNGKEQLAMTADTADKYAPRVTKIHDIVARPWIGGRGSTNINQKWWWDDQDHALHSYAHDDNDSVVFEGFNKNLVIYRNMKRDSQKFSYNGSTGFWRNDHSKRAMTIDWQNYNGSENVVTKEISGSQNSGGSNWELHYCRDTPTSDADTHDGHDHE